MNLIPISTLFIIISGIITLVLSLIVAIRTKTRVWHGESKQDMAMQPNYLDKLTAWVTFVVNYNPKVCNYKN